MKTVSIKGKSFPTVEIGSDHMPKFIVSLNGEICEIEGQWLDLEGNISKVPVSKEVEVDGEIRYQRRFIINNSLIITLNGLNYLNPKDYDGIILSDTKYKMSNVFIDDYKTMTTLPEEINTSKLTTIDSMFADCSKLTALPDLNLSKVNKPISDLAINCPQLESVPESYFTTNTTEMTNWFQNSLTTTANIPSTINLSDSVTSIDKLFYKSNLNNVININGKNVSSASFLFTSCKFQQKPANLDLENNLPNLKFANGMFHLSYINDISNFKFPKNLTTAACMFSYTNVPKPPVELNTENLIDIACMFDSTRISGQKYSLNLSNIHQGLLTKKILKSLVAEFGNDTKWKENSIIKNFQLTDDRDTFFSTFFTDSPCYSEPLALDQKNHQYFYPTHCPWVGFASIYSRTSNEINITINQTDDIIAQLTNYLLPYMLGTSKPITINGVEKGNSFSIKNGDCLYLDYGFFNNELSNFTFDFDSDLSDCDFLLLCQPGKSKTTTTHQILTKIHNLQSTNNFPIKSAVGMFARCFKDEWYQSIHESGLPSILLENANATSMFENAIIMVWDKNFLQGTIENANSMFRNAKIYGSANISSEMDLTPITSTTKHMNYMFKNSVINFYPYTIRIDGSSLESIPIEMFNTNNITWQYQNTSKHVWFELINIPNNLKNYDEWKKTRSYDLKEQFKFIRLIFQDGTKYEF